MRHSIGSVTGNIDVERTRALYEMLPKLRPEDSASVNFRQNLWLRKVALERYFRFLGIDAEKCVNLAVRSVDPFCQTVGYCGQYPIRAELGNLPEDLSFERTAFGFDLAYEKTREGPMIFFYARLPWLFEPPIPTVRYTDQMGLPERFRAPRPFDAAGEKEAAAVRRKK